MKNEEHACTHTVQIVLNCSIVLLSFFLYLNLFPYMYIYIRHWILPVDEHGMRSVDFLEADMPLIQKYTGIQHGEQVTEFLDLIGSRRLLGRTMGLFRFHVLLQQVSNHLKVFFLILGLYCKLTFPVTGQTKTKTKIDSVTCMIVYESVRKTTTKTTL